MLGSFVIPGTYTSKREPGSQAQATARPAIASSEELDSGSATVAGRIYDDRGRPIEGATVLLAGSGFWPAQTRQSGADGRFHWPDVPAGIYELRVSKGRLVAPTVEGLILEAGARRAFGIQLAPGWTIAGRVLDASTGEPIGEAEVTVTRETLGLYTRSVRTDERGRFELGGVVGDEQSLYVGAPGYLDVGPLRHTASEPPITVRLERASTVEGRVVDERSRPIEGALVRAFGERDPTLVPSQTLGVTAGPVPPISAAAGSSLAFVGEVATGADGSFRLTNLRPGSYTIAASHDDFAPAESEPLEVPARAGREGVELVMRSGAELSGRVVDERGVGLEGIPIELRASAERLRRMAVTASDGSFSFRGVRGEVSVTALPDDLPPARESLTLGDDALVTVELVLSSTLYTLRGRVVDESGFGVSGALLVVSSRRETPVERSAKSDADGRFSVPALPEPPFDLRADHPAFSPTSLSDIESIEDVRVVMSAGVTLLGEVVDDWNGAGLGNVRVQIEGPITGNTQTRNDGTFVFRRAPVGTYDISFFHPEYESQRRRVVLEAAQYVDRPQELDTVRLAPGGTVEGEVLDAHNEPVSNAEVTWGDPPRWQRATRTDARGGFRLRGVPAGSAWITARHPAAGEDSSEDLVTVRPLETSFGAFVRLPRSVTE
ncbi:MAG: carboxypeptidase regulatory-like domain-containing protein [Myxococcales bacterium]|nr:carboxypeptidase regulatory-like domain-containing protein [Myxococcales bacterium]